MLKLTIWMNHPSHHQDDLFTALARSGAVDLQILFATDMAPDRAGLGWERWNTDFPSRFLERPTFRDAIRSAIRQRDRWHIVNGIWAERAFAAALVMMRVSRAKYAIYSEAPDATVPAGILKAAMRQSFGRWIARGAAGLLAVSRLSEDFYRGIGFRADQLYKFGYFLSGEVPAPARTGAPSARTEILFVGQLIPRKGVDLLIEAAAPLFGRYPDLHLTLIGGGAERTVLESALTRAGIADRVSFAGVVPAARVRERIGAADLLVLPSRFDGWGLVVNEALSVGVPVVASDHCGAAELVRHGVNGYVFRSRDVGDLRAQLADFAADTSKRGPMRAAARATGGRISAEVVVPYLVECLNHMAGGRTARPIPPWLG
jgi:glycosyltransferase involved in cell wall biosynthesis